jgi:hypothetical protein
MECQIKTHKMIYDHTLTIFTLTLTRTFIKLLLIYLDDNSIALQFCVDWTYCQVYNCRFAKIVFITLVMKISLVIPQILKWTYTQTNEYFLENTCLRHNANLKWKFNVMEFTNHESYLIHSNRMISFLDVNFIQFQLFQVDF